MHLRHVPRTARIQALAGRIAGASACSVGVAWLLVSLGACSGQRGDPSDMTEGSALHGHHHPPPPPDSGSTADTGVDAAPEATPDAGPLDTGAPDTAVGTDAGGGTGMDSSPPSPTSLAACPSATGATRYVSPSGSDSNSGSASSPFATIQHAIDLAGPGDVTHVLAGTYTGSASPLAYVRSANTGTSGQPVVFCSDPPGAAKLDGQTSVRTGFYLEGNYIQVLGFEVTGFVGAGVSVWGTNETVVGNDIHDIGHICTDSDLGITGIYMSASSVTINANAIHAIGRLSPGENGCNPTTTYYENLDHGIYIESSTNVLVTNNLLYDNTHGWGIQVYSGSTTGSSGLTIVDNTFAFPNPYRQGQLLFAGPSVSNAVVENNVFYEPQVEGLRFSTSGSYSNVTVESNLTTGGVITASNPGGSVQVSGNYDNTDALLVSPSNNDFHLQSTSPAIDRGLTAPQVTTDLEGTARPQGAAYDVGAYEWHP